MPLHFPVYIIIIHALQIVREPFIIDCKEPEKCRLSCALSTHQTHHDFILTSRLIYPMYRRQHEKLHHFSGIGILLGSQIFRKQSSNSILSIPYKLLQILPNRMISVLAGCDIHGFVDVPLIFQSILLFQIPMKLVHIGIS